jgi:hypothetical protein
MKRRAIIADEEAAADRPTEAPRLTALDVRGEHRVLTSFTQRDLAELHLVPEGSPLVRYGWYLDLHDPGRAEFAAEGAERVKPGQRLVARDGTDPELWDALRRACGYVVGRTAG